MIQWTDEQKEAIESRGSNLLVSAAAGSGKTAVLVERIVRIIVEDGVDIDRLLIVTFTNAAAGEMRERIADALLREMESRPSREAHLRRQIHLLSRAYISTIHSFCLRVIKKYFYVIDIDPNFRIADEVETTIMKMETIEELFESEYDRADERFLGLVERFAGGKNDTSLKELVLRLYGFIQSQPHPFKWLEEKVKDFDLKLPDFERTSWYKTIRDRIEIELSGARRILEQALLKCQKPCGPASYAEAIKEDIRLIDDLKAGLRGGLNSFYKKLNSVKHLKLKKVARDVDDRLKDEVKAAREKAKSIIKGIRDDIFGKSPLEYVEELNELYPYMEYLCKLVRSFDELYKSRKKERNIVDFNDLEHFALAILENSQIAEEFRNKFEYIFVDEYQDSNLVQEVILNRIKRENNLFMVGDVKQSIYRFRLADPTLFMEKYRTFANSAGVLNRKIELNMNFRSEENIIHGVNFIFRNIMSREFGEVDYDKNAALCKGLEIAPLYDPAIEVNLIDKSSCPEIVEDSEELEVPEAEARLIARRIKQLLNTQIYDTKLQSYRNVEYRDIAVLLRTTKEWAQVFFETFIQEGIPVYADVNTGYFDTIEVTVFLNLLRIIDNKRQDIPLLSVMRSPIGGFSIEELINVRIHSDAGTYFEAVEDYIADMNDGLREKLVCFLNRLEDWKEKSRYMNMDEFIWKLLIDTGYYYYVGAMPGGIQRQANLRLLVDRARQFQKSSLKGFFNFINFIDRLKDGSGDMGTAKVLGENENVVRIMSIHKSKGLEFPVVIAAGMGKQFNLADVNSKVLFHRELGLGPDYVDPHLGYHNDTFAKIAMKDKIKFEMLSEEMRILYVAFTRARNKLIITGSVNDIKEAVRKWAQGFDTFYLARGKNYLDWICPVVMRHKDGAKLRELAGAVQSEVSVLDDESIWKINIVNKTDIDIETSEKSGEKRDFYSLLNNFPKGRYSQYREIIEQRLNWSYPYREASGIPAKLSVTDIKKLNVKDFTSVGINIPSLTEMPKFVQDSKRFSAAEKGTIIHFVMQHLDLKRVGSRADIKDQVRQMVEREFLDQTRADIVDVDKILKFFRSSIGQRILKAKRVYREVPFNLVKRACDVIPELGGCSENLLVQGVIDCYFEEGDGFVLVDYKTDYVASDTDDEIIDRYKTQMDLYREALEKITGEKVKESYLYLFHADKEVKL